MRNFTLLLSSLFIMLQGFSQTNTSDFEQIVRSERRSAANRSNFRTNSHTDNYDVKYHRLEFRVDPAVYFIRGTVTTRFVPTEDMTSITFDLTNALTVSSVTMNGNSLTYTQNSSNELVIILPAIQRAGVEASVTITYSGAPPREEDYFVTGQHNGAPILWTLSEPYGARNWWPCKQDLNDKVDAIDVYITAPAAYVSVSNGLETEQIINRDGTKTTHFRHNYPIPAYLIAIAVSNYTVFTQQAGTAPNTFPIVNYLYPENQEDSRIRLGITPPIMDLYEMLFETYPFHEEKYGHAQWGSGGGMEHTTVSFVGHFGRELIAHELGHQWFGDKVTCGSWKDIWLNEGFATYLSGLVVEHQDGAVAWSEWKREKIEDIVTRTNGHIYLTDADTLSVDRIFDSRLTYNKGAMAVHMLRFVLGDAAFYRGIKNYLADPELAFAYAKTPQLQAHLEAASGLDLTEFFNDWIYNEGYPTYRINTVQEEVGRIKIVINQSQSHPSVSYFEMPVPLRLTGATGESQDVLLQNTFDGQEFIVPVGFDVTGVQVDPEHNIISANNGASLNIENFSALSQVRLSPNPASQDVTVALPEGVVLQKAVFYNVLGQIVLETAGQSTWNISQLSAGVHLVRLETSQGIKHIKFIKE
jgi:aminopeptidase N